MQEIEIFANEIASAISTSRLDARPDLSHSARIILALPVEQLSKRFTEIIGENQVASFFRDTDPGRRSTSNHVFSLLVQLLIARCDITAEQRLSLNKVDLSEQLSQIVETIRTGIINYTVSLRLTNVDIEDDFVLAEGIRFRKLSAEEVEKRYCLERTFVAIPPFFAVQNWSKNRVEVQISKRGTPVEVQNMSRPEVAGALVNSILHPFLLLDLHQGDHPYVTHLRIESPIQNEVNLKDVKFVPEKPRALTSNDVDQLRKAYILCRDAESDRVLETALDRYFLGKKRDSHHPNRVNEPNWDKLVDYAIAMETLFMTVNGNAITQELSYRFRLNGTLLLRESGQCKVQNTFDALKHLYDIRSSVVHGGDESSIQKLANKFIAVLQIDQPSSQHALGRLALVANHVEDWLSKILFYLASLPSDARPYRKTGGWESLVWRNEW